MESTPTEKLTALAPARDFRLVLADVMALPLEDQQQLQAILHRLVGPANPQPAGTAPQIPGSQVRGAARATEWLQSLAGERPFVRLQQLDQQLQGEHSQEVLQHLEAARMRLLQEYPQLAVRQAVTRMAESSPLLVAAGAVGLVLALFGLGAGLLRGLF